MKTLNDWSQKLWSVSVMGIMFTYLYHCYEFEVVVVAVVPDTFVWWLDLAMMFGNEWRLTQNSYWKS